MQKLMMGALGVAALALASWPSVSQAGDLTDAIRLTHEAVVDLTDYPGLGKRSTAYAKPNEQEKLYGKPPSERAMESRWGADVGMIKQATGKLQDALNKAKNAGADRSAIHQLEMAIDYGKMSSQHKESRLSAQGAEYYLCKQNNNDPKEICDTVPKYGSYVAP
jgi:hypothetical protein